MIKLDNSSSAGAKILIVEDERIVAIDIGESLKSLGYDMVGIAPSGEEAIRLANEKLPDLILMDIRIKGVLDGIETARRIHAFSDIPVIYLTAFADNETINRAKTTEPYGYILKPYDKKGLHTTIEMALYKHRMERRIKESERWLAATLNSMGDAMIATNSSSHIIFMNPVAELITGWQQEEAMGKNIALVLNLFREEGKVKLPNPVDQLRETRHRIILDRNIYLVNRSGQEISVLGTASPLIDDQNNFTGAVFVFQDITEQKIVETERENLLTVTKQRVAELDAVLESIPDAVYIGDTTGIKKANKAALGFLGYSSVDEIKDLNSVAEKLHNLLDVQNNLAPDQVVFAGALKGEVTTREVMVKHSGSSINEYYRSAAAPIILEGKIIGAVTINTDITDTKKAEKEREVLFRKVSAAQERLKILSSRLMEIQELERRNLARELHDEVGQILTAIKINLQMTNQFANTPDFQTHIQGSIELTEEALKQVRSLSLDLRPSMLDDLGLIPALRWYIDRQSQRTGINARLVADPISSRFSPHLEITCYRIVQEALTNVIRHAGTDVSVKVELWIENSELHLKVSDNGKGFDVYAALQRSLSGKSMGILGMQERVELLGGTLKINSKAGVGTDIHAVFKLEKKS